ncbi:hypothetical protein DRH29_01670 [candidate division Kazan bacterium]|uniref:Uncharacterized protein n=1 Tax=candidate division Kazan bacterium TaxID=2202143 RepID=A0A420ZDB5_UNCK3|nr:MAG: hypothetical protein DRH29_01670 [candidate division Kazan bacterium]
MKNLDADLPEVSWATVFVPGLVGPKARLKSVVDGQQVNIPVLFCVRPRQTNSADWMIVLLYSRMDASSRVCAPSNGVTQNDRLSPDRFPGLSSEEDLFGKSGRLFGSPINFEL